MKCCFEGLLEMQHKVLQKLRKFVPKLPTRGTHKCSVHTVDCLWRALVSHLPPRPLPQASKNRPTYDLSCFCPQLGQCHHILFQFCVELCKHGSIIILWLTQAISRKYKGRRHEASAIEIRRAVRAYGQLRRRVGRPCEATPLLTNTSTTSL